MLTLALALLPTQVQLHAIDLNLAPPAEPIDGAPSDFARLGTDLLFAATVPGLGRELVALDGAETRVVADLVPGEASGGPAELTTIGAEVWFSADTHPGGAEIWRTDGTAAGTQQVFAAASGQNLAFVERFTALGALTLFFAHDASEGYGVWRSDGTEAGTFPLVEFGFSSQERPVAVVTVGAEAYFITSDGDALWRTDGSVGGTATVTDPSWDQLRDLIALGNETYFTVRTGGHGAPRYIGRFDGTAAEIVYAPDLGDLGYLPVDLTPFAGEVYFVGRGPNHTRGLLKLDAATEAPVFLADTDGGGTDRPDNLTPASTFLAFTGPAGFSGSDEDLWRSDGTVAGTFQIADAVPFPVEIEPTELTALGDTVVFRAATGADAVDVEPWYTDGVVVAPLGDLSAAGSSDPGEFYSDGTAVWFAANSDVFGREVWSTDGTPAGTQLAADVGTELTSGGSDPADFVRLGTRVLFTADDGVHGRELWVSEGEDGDTQLLVDAFPGSVGSNPTDITVLGDRAYFLATIDFKEDVKDFVELWVTDGTPAGTARISDLGASGQFDAEGLVAVGGRLWFSATDFDLLGREPFSSDGEVGGVAPLGNLNPNTFVQGASTADSNPNSFTAAGDIVLFRASTPSQGWRAFRSDGTAAGTFEFELESLGSIYTVFPFTADRALLRASSAEVGNELWISDGTVAGTLPISDFEPGPGSSVPVVLGVVGDIAYVSAATSATGRELARTDGTEAGTFPLVEFEPGPGDVDFEFLGAAGDRAVFRVLGDDFVWDVWASDGTPSGTVEVLSFPALTLTTGATQDVAETDSELFLLAVTAFGQLGLYRTDGTVDGTSGVFDTAAPEAMSALVAVGSGSELLLTGADSSGAEVWRSRGTPATTANLVDVVEGPVSSNPTDFVRVGDLVLFTADLPDTGRELLSLPFAEVEGWVTEPFGVACPGTGGLAPTIGANGAAQLGETVEVTVEDGLGLSTAFLFFDFGASPLPAGDCTQYVGLSSFLYAITATDVDGSAAVATPLPAGLTGLLNVPLYFQWAVVDPNGGFAPAIALSDALEVIVGPPL